MRIIIDGDACPAKNLIEKVAKQYDIDVIIYCTYDHMVRSDYSEVRMVDAGFQSVDMKVVNEVKSGDIAISQDYGVAAMALSKKAYALSPTGKIFTEDNIDLMLDRRYENQKLLRQKKKVSVARKRTSEDNERLRKSLIHLIEKE